MCKFLVMENWEWEADSFDVPHWERHGAEVEAWDEEMAAEKRAEELDNWYGEGATKRELIVLNTETNEVKRFSISFYYSVNYYAGEIKGDQNG